MNIVELREECSIRPHFTSIGVLFAYQTREFLSWKQGYDHHALTTIFPSVTLTEHSTKKQGMGTSFSWLHSGEYLFVQTYVALSQSFANGNLEC